MKNTKFSQSLNISYPIIQAPMAGGITTPRLVAASAQAGVLGMFGAGYMSPRQLSADIKQIPKSLRQRIGVNIFIPQSYQVDEAAIKKMKKHLAPYYAKYMIDADEIQLGKMDADVKKFYEQIQVVIEEKVPVVSFTFGLPPLEVVQELKSNGVLVIGTATHLQEAKQIANQGVDAIVIQNIDAGGHQASFLAEKRPLSKEEALAAIKKAVDIPLIASGGIMSQEDIEKMMALGFVAVQMGTAFLVTEESGAHPLHKKAIIDMKQDDTVMTKAFSGRQARGVKNEFIEKMTQYEKDFLPYPLLNRLTQPIRRAAKTKDNMADLSLWSGVKGYQGQGQTVHELVLSLTGEAYHE